jgi:hypothetical protein
LHDWFGSRKKNQYPESAWYDKYHAVRQSDESLEGMRLANKEHL